MYNTCKSKNQAIFKSVRNTGLYALSYKYNIVLQKPSYITTCERHLLSANYKKIHEVFIDFYPNSSVELRKLTFKYTNFPTIETDDISRLNF